MTRRLVLAWALLCGGLLPGLAAAEGCDRGIGGTGVSSDRGIGGTGEKLAISGRVLAVGPDLCVNGIAVGLAPGAVVTRDVGAGAYVRPGEIVALVVDAAMRTGAVAVLHEVVGPVERIDAAGMVVAGQRVRGAGPGRFARGDWVGVSGLRDAAGAIHASRIDRAAAGKVLVSGTASAAGDGLMLGGLRLPGAPLALAGRRIVARGVYGGAELRAAEVRAAPVADAPAMLIEAMVLAADGTLSTGEGIRARLEPGVAVSAGEAAVLLSLRAGPDGGLVVTGVREPAGARPGPSGQGRAGRGADGPAQPREAPGGRGSGGPPEPGKEPGGGPEGHGPPR